MIHKIYGSGLGVKEIRKSFTMKNVHPENNKQLAFAVDNLKSDEYLQLSKDYEFVKNGPASGLRYDLRPTNICDYTKLGKERVRKSNDVYDVAIDTLIDKKLSKGFNPRPYFGWMGFDHRKRIVSYLALVEGHMLWKKLRDEIDSQNVGIHGNNAKLKIPSGTVKDKSYTVKFGNFPVVDSNESLVLAVNLHSECGCEKKFYEGNLYSKYVNNINLFCQHEIAAYHKIYDHLRECNDRRLAINPFAEPKQKAMDFVDKSDRVIYKGKLLNKSEKNILLANICSGRGFSELFKSNNSGLYAE